jgi:predicted RNA binding protein YcfA (HicA-like mRNA interferase family)
MSNLPTLTPKKIISILESRGFLLDRIKGSHHIFYNPESNKRIVVPFHKKDLPVGTMMEILRQAGITKEELIKFL